MKRQISGTRPSLPARTAVLVPAGATCARCDFSAAFCCFRTALGARGSRGGGGTGGGRGAPAGPLCPASPRRRLGARPWRRRGAVRVRPAGPPCGATRPRRTGPPRRRAAACETQRAWARGARGPELGDGVGRCQPSAKEKWSVPLGAPGLIFRGGHVVLREEQPESVI